MLTVDIDFEQASSLVVVLDMQRFAVVVLDMQRFAVVVLDMQRFEAVGIVELRPVLYSDSLASIQPPIGVFPNST